MASRIFRSSNRYKGEDLVTGRIQKTDFMFSEICAERETKTGDKTERQTIFEGLFFTADFNKYFNGITVVVPNMAGGVVPFIRDGGGKAVRLEDPEFEKEFDVYGSDQVEARYILSTSLMQRIMDYKKKTGQIMYLSFVDSRVFVAIPSKRFNISWRKNFFKPKVFSSTVGSETMKEYLDEIQIVTDIIEDLNLNRRIWTKR